MLSRVSGFVFLRISWGTVEDAVDINCVAVGSGEANLKCLFNTGSLLKCQHCLAGVVILQARVCKVVE